MINHRLLLSPAFVCLFVLSSSSAFGATRTWINPAGGNWSVAANWDTGVPVTGDDVVISGAGTFTVTVNLFARINSLTLGDATPDGVQTLQFGAATNLALNGPSTVHPDGRIDWNDGILTGDGTLTITSGGQLVMDGATTRTFSGNLVVNNFGEARMSAGVVLMSQAKFHNQAGALLSFTGGGGFKAIAGSPFLTNAGTILKAGSGTTNMETPFNNNGSVQVTSGILNFAFNGTSAGTFTVAAGAVLQFSGAHSLTAASSVTGAGTLRFAGFGTTTIAGAINLAGGRTEFLGATPSITGPVTSLGNNVLVAGGNADISSSTPISIPETLTVSSGTLGGSAPINVTGLTQWTGGFISGTGKLTALGGFEVSGTTEKIFLNRVIENAATMTWTGARIDFNDARLVNLAGATMLIQTNSFLTATSGSPAFTNHGTIRKMSTGTTVIAPPFTNTGTVKVEAGTLHVSVHITHSGAMELSPGTTLLITGGSPAHNFTATSSITGAAHVRFGAVTTNVAGSVDLTGGSVDFNSGTTNVTGSITSLGKTMILSGSLLTANLSFPGTLNIPETLTLNGGTLTGTTPINVAGLTQWSAGQIAGTGKLTVAGGLNMSGAGTKSLRDRVIDNPVSTTWSDTGNFDLFGTAVFNNLTGAMFLIQNDRTINFLGGAPSINNQGTIRKTSTANTVISAPLANSGTVDVEAGSLQLHGNSTHSGSVKLAAGTALVLTNISTLTVHAFTASSSVSGAALFRVAGGTVNVAGAVALTGGSSEFTGGTSNLTGTITSLGNSVLISGATTTANFSFPGSLSITSLTINAGVMTGSTPVNVSGLTQWSGGTITGSGKLTAFGGLNMSTAAPKTFSGSRIIDSALTTTWSDAGSLEMSGTATLNNLAGGTFLIQNDTNVNLVTGTPAISNAGTFRKMGGAATSSIRVRFTNTGAVEATTGTLQFTNGYTQPAGTTRLNGGNIAASGTGLDIQGGVLAGTGTVTGNVRNAGSLNAGQSPGTLTITGTYIQTATGALNVEVGGPADYDRIAVTGAATLAGTLTATTIGGFDPNDGATFTIMSFASRTGDFTTKNLAYGPNRTFIATPNATNYVLTASVDEADVSITKSGPSSVLAVGTIPYSIVVGNSGPKPAAGVVVVDTLDANTAFGSVSASSLWSCAHAGGTVTCTASAPLAVGTTETILISVTAPPEGTVSNAVIVTAGTHDPNAANNRSGPVVTAITPVADLTITKSASSTPVAAGAPLQYNIAVHNNGPSPATPTTVVDTLPAGVQFASASGSGWSCGFSDAVVTCTAASIAVGAAPVITINVLAPAESGTISNTATVSSPADTTASSATVETVVTARADVSIVKTASMNPVAASEPLTFTLTVHNAGPSTATQLVVSDAIDPRFIFMSAEGMDWSCGVEGSVVECDMPSLAAGASSTISIFVRAPHEAAVVPNSASVETVTEDSNSTNNSSTVQTAVSAAIDLSVIQTDSPDPVIVGTALTYTITVTNAGPSTATNVTLSDTLPSSVTFFSASPACSHSPGTVTCSLGSLAPAGSATVTIVVTPTALGVISNTATASASETDTNPANNTATEATTVGELRADLAITKIDTPDPVTAGAMLTYTILVTNIGPDAAASVTVTDTLPAGVTLVSAGGTNWSCSGTTTVVCSLTTLQVGDADPITVIVTAATAGTITNTATVTSSTTDPQSANNSADQTTTVLGAGADVFMIKSANPSRLATGSELTYELAIGNRGPALATNVTVTDALPSAVTLLGVTASSGTCTGSSTITCSIGSLARDAIETVVIRVLTHNAGTLSNSATVSASEEDPDPTNNSDAVTTIVDPPGNVSITKTGPSTVVAGGDAAYVIQVLNGSDVALSDVSVRDIFPALLAHKRWTCSATAGSVCSRTSGSGNINIKVNLAPRGVITFEAVAQVVPGACGSITNTATIQLPEGVFDANHDNNSSSTTATVLCR